MAFRPAARVGGFTPGNRVVPGAPAPRPQPVNPIAQRRADQVQRMQQQLGLPKPAPVSQKPLIQQPAATPQPVPIAQPTPQPVPIAQPAPTPTVDPGFGVQAPEQQTAPPLFNMQPPLIPGQFGPSMQVPESNPFYDLIKKVIAQNLGQQPSPTPTLLPAQNLQQPGINWGLGQGYSGPVPIPSTPGPVAPPATLFTAPTK